MFEEERIVGKVTDWSVNFVPYGKGQISTYIHQEITANNKVALELCILI